MTALSAMQKEWVKNTEMGLMTGILVWDLSSAHKELVNIQPTNKSENKPIFELN